METTYSKYVESGALSLDYILHIYELRRAKKYQTIVDLYGIEELLDTLAAWEEMEYYERCAEIWQVIDQNSIQPFL